MHCGINKDQGVTHCGMCGICVDELDHHCIFFGKCIAKNNLSSFHHSIGFFLVSCFLFIIMQLLDISRSPSIPHVNYDENSNGYNVDLNMTASPDWSQVENPFEDHSN